MNEFDEHRVSPERFNAIKNAYDGEGRERGRGTAKNKTETQKVAAVSILTGQYLITSDDNSVVNRSLIGKFKLVEKRPEKQREAYIKIKDLEQKGLGGVITELMPYRKEVEKTYYAVYHDIKHKMSEELRNKDVQFRERVLQNYCAIPAFWTIFENHFDLPLSYRHIYNWVIDQVVALSDQISNTDILRDFWNALMLLSDQKVIRQNEHFKRECVRSVNITVTINGQRKSQHINFHEDKTIMYIQLSPCHREYQRLSRQSSGKPGIDSTSLENYIKDRPYFIGWSHATRFNIKETDIEGGIRFVSKTRSAFIIDIEKAELAGLFVEMDYQETKPPS